MLRQKDLCHDRNTISPWLMGKHTSWTFKNHITIWLLGDKIRARNKYFRKYHAYDHCYCYYLLPESFWILHGSSVWHDLKKVSFFPKEVTMQVYNETKQKKRDYREAMIYFKPVHQPPYVSVHLQTHWRVLRKRGGYTDIFREWQQKMMKSTKKA